MSIEATSHVFKNSPYPAAQSYILLAVADIVNDTYGNRFYMGVRALSKKTKCSERTIQRAFRQFEADGWLVKLSEGGGRQPSEYEFIFDRGDRLSPVTTEDLMGDDLPKGVTTEALRGDTGVTAGVTDRAFTHILELKKNTRERLSPEISEICFYLANAIGKRGLRPQPAPLVVNSQRWASEARLLLEGKIGAGDTLEAVGALAVPQIKASIDYAMNDVFWAVNILSIAKLRKQYPTLRAQALAAKQKPAKGLITTPTMIPPRFGPEDSPPKGVPMPDAIRVALKASGILVGVGRGDSHGG